MASEPEKHLSQSLALFSLLVQMKPSFVILQKNSPATGMELSVEIQRLQWNWWSFTLHGFQGRTVLRLSELREEIPQSVQQVFDCIHLILPSSLFLCFVRNQYMLEQNEKYFLGIIYLCKTISILIEKERKLNLKPSQAMRFMNKAGSEKGEAILWHGLS